MSSGHADRCSVVPRYNMISISTSLKNTLFVEVTFCIMTIKTMTVVQHEHTMILSWVAANCCEELMTNLNTQICYLTVNGNNRSIILKSRPRLITTFIVDCTYAGCCYGFVSRFSNRKIRQWAKNWLNCVPSFKITQLIHRVLRLKLL